MGGNKKGQPQPVLAVEEHHAGGRARSFCATDTVADSVGTVPRILDSFSLPSQMAALATSFLMRRVLSSGYHTRYATPEEVEPGMC